MRTLCRRILLGLLALAGLCGWAPGSFGQTYYPPPAPPKTASAGEWKFDGNKWQYEDGSAVLPPQTLPGPATYPQAPLSSKPVLPQTNPTPTYPTGPTPSYPSQPPTAYSKPSYPSQPPTAYPQTYTNPQVYPAVPYTIKLSVQTPGVSVYAKSSPLSGGLVLSSSSYWVVRYKKLTNEPWRPYASYASSSAAFNAASSLSHGGYWAAVTKKR